MVALLTISEFRNLNIGDRIHICINNQYVDAIVENYAFFNRDADEPGWEIATDCGFVSLDSAYKIVPNLSCEEVVRISLDAFKSLLPGSIIYVKNNGIFVPAIVSCPAFKSHSLENIIYNGDDWEIETSHGFIHVDSAFVRKPE